MNTKQYIVRIVDETPDEFWALIEASRQDATRFRDQLRLLKKDDLAQTCWTFEELANLLQSERSELIALPEMTDDDLLDTTNWIVTLGKERYREFLQHPERIPSGRSNPGYVDELLEEYQARFGEDLPPNNCVWDPDWRARGRSGPWVEERQ